MARHRHQYGSRQDLSAAFMPQRCEECGQWYIPAADNPLTDAMGSMFGAMMDNMTQMYGDLMGAAMGASGAYGSQSGRYGERYGGRYRGQHESGHHRHGHKHHHHHHGGDCDCDCRDEKDCDCGCRCCIGDADLVVYSRLFETRVVPLEIENGRRERKVSLALSDWKTSGGREIPGLTVTAVITPESFNLGSCEKGEAILVVRSALLEDKADVKTATVSARILDVAQEQRHELPRLPDLDDCTVLYADLRVEGCDIRPLRIALALLPRNCDPFKVNCRCGCC